MLRMIFLLLYDKYTRIIEGKQICEMTKIRGYEPWLEYRDSTLILPKLKSSFSGSMSLLTVMP